MGDVTFSGTALLIIGGLLTTLTGVIATLFRMLMSSKDAQLVSMTSERDSYKEIADDAVGTLEARVNMEREHRGEAPFKAIAPVIPEHNSPTTQKQVNTAHLATLRARFTAATMALGFPPRV
jgi:hypothetical protein